MKRFSGACAANRPWSDEDRAELLKRRRTAEIRDKYGIKAGTYSRHRRWHYTGIDIEVIRHCYATSDAPILAAAKLLGRTRTAIQAFACKHGLTRGRA